MHDIISETFKRSLLSWMIKRSFHWYCYKSYQIRFLKQIGKTRNQKNSRFRTNLTFIVWLIKIFINPTKSEVIVFVWFEWFMPHKYHYSRTVGMTGFIIELFIATVIESFWSRPVKTAEVIIVKHITLIYYSYQYTKLDDCSWLYIAHLL